MTRVGVVFGRLALGVSALLVCAGSACGHDEPLVPFGAGTAVATGGAASQTGAASTGGSDSGSAGSSAGAAGSGGTLIADAAPDWVDASEGAAGATTDGAAGDAAGDALEDAAVAMVPDFELVDLNPSSASYQQSVSPRDYLGSVSAWYFGQAT